MSLKPHTCIFPRIIVSLIPPSQHENKLKTLGRYIKTSQWGSVAQKVRPDSGCDSRRHRGSRFPQNDTQQLYHDESMAKARQSALC